jgi:hypothetical protein
MYYMYINSLLNKEIVEEDNKLLRRHKKNVDNTSSIL